MLIRREINERVGSIILDRPEKRNALSVQLIKELQDAFDAFIVDDAVKIIVIKSSGKIFCAGADLTYIQALQNFTYEENLEDSKFLDHLFYTIYTSPKVTIAQVEGLAIAGGCGLAFCTDFVFATPSAQFGYSEVNIGFVPALVSIYLTKKVGEATAKHLLLDGLNISSEEAYRRHLVYKIVAEDFIAEEVMKFASMMVTKKSGISLTMTKELIHTALDLSVRDGLDLAREYNAKARGTKDCKKGIAGFLNKQPIVW